MPAGVPDLDALRVLPDWQSTLPGAVCVTMLVDMTESFFKSIRRMAQRTRACLSLGTSEVQPKRVQPFSAESERQVSRIVLGDRAHGL